MPNTRLFCEHRKETLSLAYNKISHIFATSALIWLIYIVYYCCPGKVGIILPPRKRDSPRGRAGIPLAISDQKWGGCLILVTLGQQRLLVVCLIGADQFHTGAHQLQDWCAPITSIVCIHIVIVWAMSEDFLPNFFPFERLFAFGTKRRSDW